MRILPTNKYLKRCGLVQSDMCYFCNSEVETIEHIFWFCPVIERFWLDFATRLHDTCNIQLDLNPKSVCLGYLGVVNKHLINHIINLVKRYIYISKCKEKYLNMDAVFSFIRYHYLLEKNVVEYHKKNPDFFHDKWHPLIDIL